MTQKQWDEAVIKSAEKEVLLHLKRYYDIYGATFETTGNCNTVTSNIIEKNRGEF